MVLLPLVFEILVRLTCTSFLSFFFPVSVYQASFLPRKVLVYLGFFFLSRSPGSEVHTVLLEDSLP